MDAIAIGLIMLGLIAAVAFIYVGWRLDRRAQRAISAKWMRAWTIRTRVLAELWGKLNGPLRLTGATKPPPRSRDYAPTEKSTAPGRADLDIPPIVNCCSRCLLAGRLDQFVIPETNWARNL
jgi:hypothetical protein